jgi:hypothetical protein
VEACEVQGCVQASRPQSDGIPRAVPQDWRGLGLSSYPFLDRGHGADPIRLVRLVSSFESEVAC